MKDKIITILKEFEQIDYKLGGVSIAPGSYNAIADKIYRELIKPEIEKKSHNNPIESECSLCGTLFKRAINLCNDCSTH